jgi:hypothetical protein
MAISSLYPTIRPSLNLNFAKTKRLDPRITFTRNSTGTYTDAQGILRAAGVNEPRFDHNPTTGESLGLLVEESRTNSIRNNTMVGAVAGTPGTLPTNWVQSSLGTGLTSQVVATGTQSGIAYIDIRVSGTAGDTSGWSVNFDANTAIAASSGQAWTGSAYIAIIGGTLNGTANQFIRVIERNGAGGYVTESNALWSSAGSSFSAASRLSIARPSMGGTTSFVQSGVYFTSIIGQAIDITLRIGLPQLEQGAFVSSVIPTTGTAATRTADVASISGTNFSSWYRQDEGTVFADAYREFAVPSNFFPHVFDARNTGNDIIQIAYNTESLGTGHSRTSGVDQAVLFPLGLTGVRRRRATFAYKTDDFAAVVNGGSVVTDNSGTPSSVINQAALGGQYGSSSFNLNGTIRRLTYWGQRLQNNILQSITL